MDKLDSDQICIQMSISFNALIFCLFLVAIIPALFEEFLFRGIILKIGLSQYKSALKAIIYQALIFAILHLSYYELPGILMIGALLGYIAKETKSIWSGVVTHATFNGLTVILFTEVVDVPHALVAVTIILKVVEEVKLIVVVVPVVGLNTTPAAPTTLHP